MPLISPSADEELRVLDTRRTSDLTGLSIPVLERLRVTGDGPPWVRLSTRRVGYRAADLRAWMDRQTVRAGCPGVDPSTIVSV
jgi:predicted DNA-binding transcriptional regulator AlpA